MFPLSSTVSCEQVTEAQSTLVDQFPEHYSGHAMRAANDCGSASDMSDNSVELSLDTDVESKHLSTSSSKDNDGGWESTADSAGGDLHQHPLVWPSRTQKRKRAEELDHKARRSLVTKRATEEPEYVFEE